MLYPMLSKRVRDGDLTCQTERDERTSRKVHTITDKGREGLALARVQMRELKGKDQAE
jgi:PadR family transcriptional regulator PadR